MARDGHQGQGDSQGNSQENVLNNAVEHQATPDRGTDEHRAAERDNQQNTLAATTATGAESSQQNTYANQPNDPSSEPDEQAEQGNQQPVVEDANSPQGGASGARGAGPDSAPSGESGSPEDDAGNRAAPQGVGGDTGGEDSGRPAGSAQSESGSGGSPSADGESGGVSGAGSSGGASNELDTETTSETFEVDVANAATKGPAVEDELDTETVSETFEIQVDNVNDEVVIDGDAPAIAISGTEDQSLIITEAELLANASDVDGDTLTVTNIEIDNATVETVVDPNTGETTFVVTPDADVNGSLEIRYDVSDQQGSEVATTATLDLAAVNDAAVVAQDTEVVGTEDTEIIFTQDMLLQHVSDIDSDNLTAENLQIAPEYGSVVDNQDGTFTFTPAQDYNGDVPFTFDVNDNDGAITPALGNVDVAAVNDAAVVAQDTEVVGTEDTEIIFTQDMLLQHVSDIDSDNVTAENLQIAPEYGTVVDNQDGTFTFTPADDYNGDVPFTFDVNDNDGAITPASGNVDLAAVNDAAVVAQDTEVVGTEDTEIVFTQDMLLQHVSDIDSNNVTAENLQIAPEYGSVVDNQDGTFTFTPAQDYNGDVPFTFDVNDNDGAITPASGNVDVAAVNDAAVVAQDTEVVGTEDTEIVFTQDMLLQHVSDIDSDNVTAENLQIAPEYGSVVDNQDGTFTFTPADDYNGDVPFTFDVSDNDGAITSASGNVELAAVNDAAVVAQDTEVVGTEDTEIIFTQDMLLQHITDIDSDNLTAENLQIAPEYGSVVDNQDGTFTFTPADDYNGDVPFTFDVNDNDGAITPASGNVDLAAVNDAAVVAQDTEVVGTEDTEIVFTQDMLLQHVTDIDSDNVTAENLQIAPEYGSLVDNQDGTFTFTPADDYNGDVPFTFDVNDNDGAITPASGNVDVVAVNDAAVVAQDTEVVGTEDTEIVFTQDMLLQHVSDIDSDNLTAENLQIAPEYGTVVDNQDGTFTFTPAQDYNGDVPFTFDVNDNDGAITQASGNVELAAVNDAAVVAQDTDVVGTEDTEIVFTQDMLLQHVSDIDSDNVTAENLQIAPEYGSVVDNQDGTFTFTPAQDYNGDVPFTFDVNDNDGAITPASGNVDLAAANDAPVLAETSFTLNEDGSIIIDPATLLENATDIDGDELSISNITSDEHGSVTQNEQGEWVYTPNADYSGEAELTITVFDGTVHTDFPAPVTVTPDADAPSLTVSLTDGAVNVQPTIQIFNANQPAQPASAANTFDEDTPVPLNISAAVTDTDGSESMQSLVLDDIPEGATLTDGTHTFTADGDTHSVDITEWDMSQITFQGAENFHGSVSLSLTATSQEDSTMSGDSPETASTTTAIEFEIVPVNDEVVIDDEERLDFATQEDTAIVITEAELLANASDVDGDTLMVTNLTMDSGSARLVVDPDSGERSFVITPNQDVNGDFTLHFDVSDGNGSVVASNAQLTVSPENDAAVVSQETEVAGTEDTDVIFTQDMLLQYATDIDSDNLTAENLQIAPEYGSVVDNQDGTFTFTPAADYNGDVPFTFDVNDNDGAITPASGNVDLAAVNDAAVVAQDTEVVGTEDTDVIFTQDMLLQHVSDIDSDNLTAENLQIAPEYGSVVDNQDGTFTFTPAQDYNGDVPFTFDVNDNDGGVTPASGNVDLAAVNDAAVVAQDSDIAGREDTDLIITQDMLLQHATDIDSDHLTAENLQIAPEYGTVKDNGDGTFTFSPTENYHGEVPFTFDVNDNDGAITPASGQIDVASVNDRVIAQDDNQMSASDPMIRLESAPQHGSVEYMNADGEWTEMVVGEEYPADTQVQFVPDAEDVQSGTRDIQVGSFDSDTSTHVFDGRASVDDWGDVDGNTAVYTEDGVTITTEVNTGELAAWNGAGSHVGAGIGNQSRHGLDTNEMLTVTVEGEDVNQITFQLDGLGGYFDETSRNATEVLISAYDADGNLIDAQGGYRESGDYQDTYVFTTDVPVHHFTLGTTGSNGTYVVQNMTVSRTMSDEIQMTTIQPDGSEVLNTVNLDLNHNTAHDPVDVTESLIEVDEGITTQAIKVEEDGQLVLNPSELLKNDTDADGDTLTIIGVEATDDTHGEVSLDEDGNVVFTPDADYNGPASFTYIVSDGNGSTDTASVTVDVTPVNDDPVAPTVTMNGDEDQVIVIDPAFILQQASDTDGDQLTLESLSLKNPQNGQLQLQQDGTYHLLTPPDFNGLVELDYQISDGTEIVDGNMKVDVLPVNDAPFHGGNAQLTTYEDGAFTFRADDMLDLFRDVDGDDLVVSRVITADGEEGGELTQNDDGSWTFTPAENYAGTAELQVEVTDPSGATAMLDVPLFIRPVADGAVITTDHDGPLVFDEDTTGLLGLNVDMVDASEQLSHLVITGFPVGFEVSDGVNSVVITEPGQVVDITEWSFNDLSMTPPQDFVGNFFVTVSATTADYGEESSSQVSEPTEAYADFTTTQDEALLLTAEDLLDMVGEQEGGEGADAEDIQGVHLIDRSQGELTDNGDGTWSFVPADDFTGQVDFAYQIQQGDTLVDVQSSIAVGEASDGAAPEANAAPTVDQIVTTELGAGNSLTFTTDDLLGQISDGDNDELSIESVQVINGQGVLETHDNGTYSFTPAEGFSGMAQIAFVATDGEASVRSHFNVDVAEAAPSGDFMLDEMGALVLSAEDIRESLNLADTVDITQVDYHGEAGTLIEDEGQWVFWSDDDFEGQLDLEVTAQDGDTSSVHDLSLTVDEYQDTAPQSQPFQADRMEDDSAQETVDTQTVEEDGSAEEAGNNDDSADLTAAPGSDVRFTLPEEVTDNPDVQQVEITNLPEGATLNTGIPDGEGGYTLSGDLSQPVIMTLPEGNEGTTTMQFEGQTDVGAPVAGAEGSLTIEVDDEYAMQSGGQGGDSPQGMQDESEQGDWTQGDNTNMGVDVMDDSASYDNDGAGSQQEDAGMMDDSMTP